ncbi:hypothetical protein [Streptomyces sp. NPDC012888]|uniref:hypothetical protein n=1 Tax=Streptomyces sp. NPDC012888 TaxID=3364855 RepID=UPI0036CBDDC3
MKPDEVFRFTAAEREQLERGWAEMVAEREVEQWRAAIGAAAPGLVAQAVKASRVAGRRGRMRRAYGYATRFAGVLTVCVVAGSVGLFLAAAVAAR